MGRIELVNAHRWIVSRIAALGIALAVGLWTPAAHAVDATLSPIQIQALHRLDAEFICPEKLSAPEAQVQALGAYSLKFALATGSISAQRTSQAWMAALRAHHCNSTLEEVRDDIQSPSAPPSVETWSLDGGYLYLLVNRYAVSGEIIQVRKSDGLTRDVIDGNSLAVIRSGPYRGYLLVQRHRYRPEGGSYNPTFIVRPDGKELHQVPGTEADDGENHSGAWLRSKGWQAW
jgi:hypothetical protein